MSTAYCPHPATRRAHIYNLFLQHAIRNYRMSYSSTSRKRSNVSAATAFVTLTIQGRTRRGALDILPSLPLDILCEIFCFVHPADLLVLARTSKAFRTFLLKRSTTFIWRSARKNVDGLPDPPSDMSEIQYASLVFGLACHYEGCDRKARDTLWHLRIRSCASCRSKHQPVKVHDSDDILDVCDMLQCHPDTIGKYIPCGPFLNSKGNTTKGFQEPHIRAFKHDLRTLSLSERQAYLDRRRQASEIVGQFATAGVAWQLNVKNVRITELRNKRAARGEIIRESLIAIGFQEEIDHFGWDRIRKHPLISSTQAMTDKTRSVVLDQLRTYMLGWRELRMEEQVYAFRRRVFVDAWLQFTATAFYNAPSDCPYLPLPPSATIGFFDGIDSAIRQSGPASLESLLKQLYATFPRACEYILEWQKTVRRELASLLPDYMAVDDDSAIHAKLKLATSVFHCSAGRNCRSEGCTLSYPEILFHPCFTLVTPGNRPSSKDPGNIANQKACLVMGGSPWSCSGRVQVHPKRHVVNQVLLCCGKDPRSTTAAEMDEDDPRLLCLECAFCDRIITFMSWRLAIQHHIKFHPNSTVDEPWLMISRTFRERVDKLQCLGWQPFSSGPGDTLSCSCIPSWDTRFGFGDLIDHMKHNEHGIASPVFGNFDTNVTPVCMTLEKIR